MALDPYSLCPGGREKKIRFCCPDMIKEIGQIERMLETNQGSACLSFIETLEKDHQDCACLTVAKLSVYRTENKWEDALQLAKIFYEKEPENPVAVAEYALALAVNGRDPKQTISLLIDGFEHSPQGTAHSSLINVTLQIGTCLLIQGFVLPVIAISNQLKRFPTVQDSATALFCRASSMVEFPILLRDMVFDSDCPDHFPKKEEFAEAMDLISQMRWKQGLAKLESLAQYDQIWSAIWRNIAAVRFWLLDEEGGCEALKKFIALPNTLLEDAVDAEATRIFIDENALGDQIPNLYFEYEIHDAETVYEKLLSNPLYYSITLNLPQDANVPAPKGGFLLLDRPCPTPETPLTLDNISSQLAMVFVFGKETDREARIMITDVWASDRLNVEQIVKETLGDFITQLNYTHTIRTISKLDTMLQPRFIYYQQAKSNMNMPEQLKRDYYEHVFANRWCKLPFGLLDQKTPNEVAKDPAYRIRLLGMIQAIETRLEEEDMADWFANILRAKLGLPTSEPIVIPAGSDEEMLENLENRPVWRWYRFEVEKLPTAFLVEGFQIVTTMQERRANKKFARELLNRPHDTMSIQIRSLAFESLIRLARNANQLDTALEWIENAKKEVASNNLPEVAFLLHEVPIRLALGQVDKFQEVVNYLVSKYNHNEKVMQALQNMFIQLGILKADGTPNDAVMPDNVPMNASPKPDGIWTPETVTKDDNHTKLWTPEG